MNEEKELRRIQEEYAVEYYFIDYVQERILDIEKWNKVKKYVQDYRKQVIEAIDKSSEENQTKKKLTEEVKKDPLTFFAYHNVLNGRHEFVDKFPFLEPFLRENSFFEKYFDLSNDAHKSVYEKRNISDIDSVSKYLDSVINIIGSIEDFGFELYFEDNELKINRENKKLNEIINRGETFFRGESKIHKYMIPSLYRSSKYLEKEKEMFENLRKSKPSYFPRMTKQFDQLAVAQHHGLPTRILDITTNPLIALYFAVSENLDEDGYVSLFRPSKDNSSINTSNSDKVSIESSFSLLEYGQLKEIATLYKESNEEIVNISNNYGLINNSIDSLYHAIRLDNFDFSQRIKSNDLFNILFVKPESLDERIIRQSGAFMIVGLNGLYESSKFIDPKIRNNVLNTIVTYDIEQNGIKKYKREYLLNFDKKLSDTGKKKGVAKIRIKKAYKKLILDELNLLGINASTVYSDIDSKAKFIRDSV